MIKKSMVTIFLVVPIFTLGQTSDCQTQRVKERTWCTDRYYSTITGPTEDKRLLDQNLDLELDSRTSACESQFDLGDCERNMKLDQANADTLYYSSMDKANKIWMTSMAICAGTALVPIPGVAQGAAGACAISATSALTLAYITIGSDYSAAVRIANNKKESCLESLTSKLQNCKSTVSKDIANRRRNAQAKLDSIVSSALNEETGCIEAAEYRYQQCLNNWR
jgi:hypothetical protein